MVCRVVVTGTGEAAGLQELVGGVDLAQEGRPALRHEEDLVEHLHQVAAGLVDGADDSPALAGQSPQRLHHSGRHEAVQAGGGLVTEHDAGVGQHLTCQRQSLPLSPGYSLLALVLLPYHRVRTLCEPKLEEGRENIRERDSSYLLNDLLHLAPLHLLRQVAVHPDEGLEGEVFPHSERPYQQVVLLHVGGHGGEAGGRHQLVIGPPRAGHLQPLQVPEGRVHLILYCKLLN